MRNNKVFFEVTVKEEFLQTFHWFYNPFPLKHMQTRLTVNVSYCILRQCHPMQYQTICVNSDLQIARAQRHFINSLNF